MTGPQAGEPTQTGETVSEMALSRSDRTSPVSQPAVRSANERVPSKAEAGLERTIFALTEELRKTHVKMAGAKARHEWQELKVLRDSKAALYTRLETAKRLLKQVQQTRDQASRFIAEMDTFSGR